MFVTINTDDGDLVAVADRALYLAKPADRMRLGHRRPDARPVSRRHRRDDAAAAGTARAAPAAARDRRPGRQPRRREARVPVPPRGQRRRSRSRVPRGRRPVRRARRLPPAARHGHRVGRGENRPADERRRLRRVPQPRRRARRPGLRSGVRGPADLRRRGAGHDRARVGRSDASVQRARAGGAGPVRAAGVDRPGQRADCSSVPRRRGASVPMPPCTTC